MTITTKDVQGMLAAIHKKISAHTEALNQLDAALGDGDHGTGISTGFAATLEPITHAETPTDVLKVAAMQLMNRMGGTSGAIFGTLYLKAAVALPPTSEITTDQFITMWKAGREGVAQRGKAEIGDKTLFDALSPAVDALAENAQMGKPFIDSLLAAKQAAATGAEATVNMQAQHGRAKYIGERAIGHMDAGAKSIALMFEAIHEYFEEHHNAET